jgi:succinate dehydrogenase hydrophobic anchor subunit
MSMKDTKLWTWHMASGVVVLVLLGAHMLTMHLNGVLPIESLNPAGDDPLDWANVVARGREVSQVVGYILLVGFGLFHGLYGLRNILFELNPAAGLKKLISVVLLLLGLGMFIYGTWSAIAARTIALSVTG